MKLESEVKIEKEKNHYLKGEKDDLEGSKLSSEYKVIKLTVCITLESHTC